MIFIRYKMKVHKLNMVLFLAVGGFLFYSLSGKNESKTPQLKVSENQRFLMDSEGKPFFWLGNTGWLLFSKLTRETAATQKSALSKTVAF
jgi:hypothetical protein